MGQNISLYSCPSFTPLRSALSLFRGLFLYKTHRSSTSPLHPHLWEVHGRPNHPYRTPALPETEGPVSSPSRRVSLPKLSDYGPKSRGVSQSPVLYSPTRLPEEVRTTP